LNYAYSLPNKLFDYIHAGLPVLVSDLPELRRVVETYKIGAVVRQVEPQEIAVSLQQMFDGGSLSVWSKNAIHAAQELNWQREQEVVRSVYGAFL
jgi:glycosyltransferase involved in cell wall biosynthesis